MISSPASSSAKKKSRGPHQKARPDVFTVQLAIALVAILIGIVFLYLENEVYDWDFESGPSVSAGLAPGPAPVLAMAPAAYSPRLPFATMSTDAPTTAALLPLRSGG